MIEPPSDAVAAMTAVPIGPRRTPARNFASRLFGYDVFISFALGGPPRGSHSYASDLARRLRERDFTVFFSEDEAPPGSPLDSTLLRALDSSRLLVVIANRGTLAEPRWVRKEVEEFRRRHPDRLVIPVSVGGALQDPTLADSAQEWLQYQDKIWVDEVADACETGIASESLVERLATAPTRVRANVRWRRVVRGVIVALAGLAIALGVAAKMATDAAERARAELRRSVSLRLTGEAPTMLTGARAGGDEQALQQVLVARTLAGDTVEVEGAMLSTLQAVSSLLKVVGTGVSVGAMTFSRDGRLVVTGGSDGTLQLWNAATLEPIGVPLAAKQGAITSVALGADGGTLVSGSEDGTLQRWDMTRRTPVGEPMMAHKSTQPEWSDFGVQTVAISPDGTRLASSGWDGTLKLWDARSGRQQGKPLFDQEGYVYFGIAFSDDGSRLVSAGNDPIVTLWDVQTGRVIRRLDLGDVLKGNDEVVSVAFKPAVRDGSVIVLGTKAQGVWLWDARSGRRTALVGRPAGQIATVAFDADGMRVLAATEEGYVHRWDATTRQAIAGALPTGARDSQTRVAFSRDGARIATGDEDGRIRMWDATTASSMHAVLSAGTRQGPDAVFGADGVLVALRRADGKVEVRSTQGGAPARVLVGGPSTEENLAALSPDGSRLVSTSKALGGPDEGPGSGAVLRIWDTKSGQLVGAPVTAERHRDFNGAVFRPDGWRFVTYEQQGDTPGDGVTADGRLQVWDAVSGKPIGKPLEGHQGGVRHAAFSPDGTQLVSAGADDTVRRWNADTQVPLDAPVMPHANVAVVAFSPDGTQIVSGDDGGKVRVWNASAIGRNGAKLSGPAQPTATLSFGGAQIWSLVMSPDGRRVVTSSTEGIRLWDAHTGRAVGRLPLPEAEGPVFDVTFNREGALVGLSRTGAVLLWPGPATWSQRLCAKLTRNLSPRQWQQWTSPEIDYRPPCPGLPVAE